MACQTLGAACPPGTSLPRPKATSDSVPPHSSEGPRPRALGALGGRVINRPHAKLRVEGVFDLPKALPVALAALHCTTLHCIHYILMMDQSLKPGGEAGGSVPRGTFSATNAKQTSPIQAAPHGRIIFLTLFYAHLRLI